MQNLIIDPEAKGRIPLTRVTDANGASYFIGKLQLPCSMKFSGGASFMVFTSEEGTEELQIAPMDPVKLGRLNTESRNRLGANMNQGKLTIYLRKMLDQYQNTYYIGEVVGPTEIDLVHGIFFTIFTSITGQEQIQITKLQIRRRDDVSRSNRRLNIQKSNTFNPDDYR